MRPMAAMVCSSTGAILNAISLLMVDDAKRWVVMAVGWTFILLAIALLVIEWRSWRTR